MIQLDSISKKYKNKVIFKNYNVNIVKGEFVCITGESGKGKSTLINIMSLLEKPDSGTIRINNIENPGKKDKLLLRRHYFGYIFQNYALIENMSVEKNLLISLEYKSNIDKKVFIDEVLEKVKLSGYNKKKIYELSGGEQQRVAIARLLLKDCEVIFADEPTGNLDRNNANIVFELLKNLNQLGKTIVMVSHDQELINRCDTIINL